MSWTNFLSYLGLAYLLYYALNFLMDFFNKRNHFSSVVSSESGEQYQVEGLEQPIQVSALFESENPDFSSEPLLTSGEIESSGGQRFEQIMEAASKELIECTKRIL